MQLTVSFVPGKLVFQKGRAIDTGEVEIGAQVMQTIPPGLFWRFQITIHHPVYLKFNISLAKDSLLGIYGRRNIPPTHTQVISNNTNSLCFVFSLVFSDSSGCRCSQINFQRTGGREGPAVTTNSRLFIPYFYWGLAIPPNCALRGRDKGGDSVTVEVSAVVTTAMWLSTGWTGYPVLLCGSCVCCAGALGWSTR